MKVSNYRWLIVLVALATLIGTIGNQTQAVDTKSNCCADVKCCGDKACSGECCKTGTCTTDCAAKVSSANSSSKVAATKTACCTDGKCCGDKDCNCICQSRLIPYMQILKKETLEN